VNSARTPATALCGLVLFLSACGVTPQESDTVCSAEEPDVELRSVHPNEPLPLGAEFAEDLEAKRKDSDRPGQHTSLLGCQHSQGGVNPLFGLLAAMLAVLVKR